MGDGRNQGISESEEDWSDRFVRCKYCGCINLHWVETERGFRLAYPDGKIHDCPLHPNRKTN